MIRPKNIKLHHILVIMLLIIVAVWGIVMRTYGLSQQSFWIDEAYSITTAQAIVDHGYPLLDSGQTQWRSPVYHYVLAGAMAIFGDGEVTTRAVSVGVGIIAIGLFSFISYSWFGKRPAVITFIITSLSYWEIAWSRQARMYMLLQVLFWGALFAYERWWSARRKHGSVNRNIHGNTHRRWAWWCGGLTLVAIGTHEFALLLPVTYGLYWLIQWLLSRSRPAWYVASIYTGALVVAWGVALLSIHWWIYQGPLVDYWGHYVNFLMREYVTLLILSVVGIWVALRRIQQHLVMWLVGMTVLFISIISYGVPLLHYRYLFMIVPIFILFGAVGIDWLSRMQIGRYAWFGTVVIGVLIVSCTELTYLPQRDWLLESDSITSQIGYKSFTPQPPYHDVYDMLAEIQPQILITPYPAVTRLYLDRDDTYVLPISLTGASHEQVSAQNSSPELYSGISYITAPRLLELIETQKVGEHIYILVDRLAIERLDIELQDIIDNQFTLAYHVQLALDNQDVAVPWTEVWLYEH